MAAASTGATNSRPNRAEPKRGVVQRVVSAPVAFLVLMGPVRSQSIFDGDTLKLGGTTFRLWGVDAPESQQSCADGWPAGRASKSFLRDLAHDKTITCEAKIIDRYRRTIAICRAAEKDLGATMVAARMALAFVRYSSDYVAEEDIARAAILGVHAHDCAPAREWRARQRSARLR